MNIVLNNVMASLRNELNIPAGEDDVLAEKISTAVAYVDSALGGATIPQSVYDDCVVGCAADLYNRKSAQLGIMDTGMDGVQPYRIPLDPLRSVWPKLNAIGVLTGRSVIV